MSTERSRHRGQPDDTLFRPADEPLLEFVGDGRHRQGAHFDSCAFPGASDSQARADDPMMIDATGI
jgi:hypothetical protein